MSLVVIDTAPHASAGALAASKLADLVLVPCRPSAPDLAAIGASLEVATLASAPAAVVLNAVPARGSLAAEAIDAVRSTGARVAPVTLGARIAHVHYCGDHDPSGLDMDRDIAERLAALGADAAFQRVALTHEQIDAHDLIPQPTKSADTRSSGYSADGSWELEALPVPALVGHVRKAIEELLPEDFHARQAADQADRARLHHVAASFERAA